ncbi:MAG: hypothetical protein WAU24_11040, partial [Chitinophagaceae bacterium]
CNSISDNSGLKNLADSSTTVVSDTTIFPNQTTFDADSIIIPKTFLHDTTIVSGNFILFLRPDSARFESYTKDPQSVIYETDSDFGFGIKGTHDSISKNTKYKNIKAIVSTDRYIIIKDCKNCPLTIDRDTIDYGVILSSAGGQIKTTYGFVHSGDYMQDVDEYFKIKK